MRCISPKALSLMASFWCNVREGFGSHFNVLFGLMLPFLFYYK